MFFLKLTLRKQHECMNVHTSLRRVLRFVLQLLRIFYLFTIMPFKIRNIAVKCSKKAFFSRFKYDLFWNGQRLEWGFSLPQLKQFLCRINIKYLDWNSHQSRHKILQTFTICFSFYPFISSHMSIRDIFILRLHQQSSYIQFKGFFILWLYQQSSRNAGGTFWEKYRKYFL